FRGHPDRVDPAPHAVLGVHIVAMMASRRLPPDTEHRRYIMQAAGPQYVARTAISPMPPGTRLVVVPLALVDQVGEPLGIRVWVPGSVQPPRVSDKAPTGAFGVPVGADRGRRSAGRPGDRGDEPLVL